MPRQYLKAIPTSWTCIQTYFRNHQAINYALDKLHKLNIAGKHITVLDVGSGVLEPFIVGAMLEKCRRAGLIGDYSVVCLDKSEIVINILKSLVNSDTLSSLEGQLITDAGVLFVLNLAPLFSSPESKINPHLSIPDRLSQQLGQLQALGLLELLGLPQPDRPDWQEVLETEGMEPPPAIIERLSLKQGDILTTDTDILEKATLAVSNFSLQYPIMDGHTGQVIDKITRCFDTQTVFENAGTYVTQAKFLEAYHRNTNSPAIDFTELAIREMDAVPYVDDADGALRLRVRTDILLGPAQVHVATPRIREITSLVEELGGILHHFASTKELADNMLLFDGLQSDTMFPWAYRAGDGHIVAWRVEREKLLKEPIVFKSIRLAL